MNNKLLKFLPLAAVLFIVVSCSKDEVGTSALTPYINDSSTVEKTNAPISVPFTITVGGKTASLVKAQVVEDGSNLTQKFSNSDVLIITGKGLDENKSSILSISSDDIGKETATFTGELYLSSDGALESGVSQLTAVLANKTLGNEGKPLDAPILVSDLANAFQKYGYLMAKFTYDAGVTQINLEQHTAFLVFDLSYNGAKVNVKIGEETTPIFISRKQVLAVPDGATITSQLMKNSLEINLQPKTAHERVVVVFDIKREDLPDDCIPGLFSVSADKQVYFSKGNLQYNTATKNFQFADYQWSCISGGGANAGSSGVRDLFGWGTWLKDGNPMNNSTQYSGYIWADNNTSAIGNDWITLSKEEWAYLLENGRKNAKNLCKWQSVNNVNGLIILPDGYNTVNIKWTDWSTLESAGAVFLPAAGCRKNGSMVYDVGEHGCYWSSTADQNSFAFFLDFYSNFVFPERSYYRDIGYSVRLVRAAQ